MPSTATSRAASGRSSRGIWRRRRSRRRSRDGSDSILVEACRGRGCSESPRTCFGATREEARRLRAFARVDAQREDTPPEEPRLASALGALSVEERDALLLYAWAELSYDEIAEALAVPVGTVRSRLHRARSRLREALTQEEALDG
jgi:RNA polymerase sigma factor (sigma-70 family)